MEDWTCAIPWDKSWNVALGCMTVRKALGSNDFELIKMDASAHRCQRSPRRQHVERDAHWIPCPYRGRCARRQTRSSYTERDTLDGRSNTQRIALSIAGVARQRAGHGILEVVVDFLPLTWALSDDKDTQMQWRAYVGFRVDIL